MTRATERASEHFKALGEVLGAERVVMSGAWSGKAQRRLASPDHDGTSEGPYVEAIDWRWEGALESTSPIVGIAMLVLDDEFYWVKSEPPVTRPPVSFSTHGWTGHPCAMSVTGSFHGAALPSAPSEAADEPPASCIIGPPVTSTGTLHVVGRVEQVAFAVVLLPAAAVEVGRNRLWRLREGIAAGLPRNLRELMTRRRSGKVLWGGPPPRG